MKKRVQERGKNSRRTDDNIDSLMKRFRTFEEDTMPVLDKYKENGKLVTVRNFLMLRFVNNI